MLPESLLGCLSAFESCFTAPSHRRFLTLMHGWLVCIGKHTVTGVMRAAGVAEQDVSGYHRFFSRGAWDPQEVGLVVLRLALRLVPDDAPVAMTLDDTLARHTGKHIASAGMHRDPLLSTGNRPFFHFGHKWVVLAVVVTMPWGKRLSLPVLARLYRSEKAAKAAGQPHVKLTVLALQMLAELGKRHGSRRFVVYADNAYVNRTIVQNRPNNVELVGRGRMDAALYALPPRRTKSTKGRPRIRGAKLHSPQVRADSKRGWTRLTVDIYGRDAVVKVKVFDAIWYKVSHGSSMRIVTVRGWPGQRRSSRATASAGHSRRPSAGSRAGSVSRTRTTAPSTPSIALHPWRCGATRWSSSGTCSGPGAARRCRCARTGGSVTRQRRVSRTCLRHCVGSAGAFGFLIEPMRAAWIKSRCHHC